MIKRLFDTHCHLQDDRLAGIVDAVVNRALSAGVTTMVCCGSTERDWHQVLALAEEYPSVVPALGVHPWHIGEQAEGWIDRLEVLARTSSRIAIGEIGLDHALSARNDDHQLECFRKQLVLARKYDRPVSIHCRKAWENLTALFRVGPELATRSVIHSYSGPVELVDELIKRGVFLSFSGSITYSNNRRGREAAKHVPLDRLLIETDSPDIAPAGHDGANEPATVLQVAETVASLRGMTVEEIAEITFSNSKRLFIS